MGNALRVKPITAPEEKQSIALAILTALPDWFGIEQAREDYILTVRDRIFWAAMDGDAVIGFLALTQHNLHTDEIYVMGVLQGHHRSGAGRALIEAALGHCRAQDKSFLTVKTLDASVDYAPYDNTRAFYQRMGFLPLEVFPTLWGEENPCLFMARTI